MIYPPDIAGWLPLVEQYVPPPYVDEFMWVMEQESHGDPSAQNPTSTATGLMQILAGVYGRPGVAYFQDPTNNIRWAAQQLGAAHGDFSAWGQGVGAGYRNPYGLYPGPGWTGGVVAQSPAPLIGQTGPGPGPFPSVGLPPTDTGDLNIAQSQLYAGVFQVVELAYGGTVPTPEAGFWSEWDWVGGSWQEFTPGEYLAPGRVIGLLPPGANIPGNGEARVNTANLAAQSVSPQVATLLSYTTPPPSPYAFGVSALPPSGAGGQPGLGPTSFATPLPTSEIGASAPAEDAWANYLDWSVNNVPVYVAQLQSLAANL